MASAADAATRRLTDPSRPRRPSDSIPLTPVKRPGRPRRRSVLVRPRRRSVPFDPADPARTARGVVVERRRRPCASKPEVVERKRVRVESLVAGLSLERADGVGDWAHGVVTALLSLVGFSGAAAGRVAGLPRARGVRLDLVFASLSASAGRRATANV